MAVKSLLQTRYSGRSRLQVSGGSHPDPEIRWRLFGPQFRLKIRKWGAGGVRSPGPLPWIRHCIRYIILARSMTDKAAIK